MNKRQATSADVAALAGVSQSTVSRSFDEKSRISAATRDRVFAAAKELGYQVNKAAQTMIKQRSDLVGLVTAGLEDPFRSEFLNQLVIEVQRQGFRPMVIDVTHNQGIDSSLQALMQYQLSGVVITSGSPSESIVQEFVSRSVPVILVNRADQESNLSGVDIVNIDNVGGGELAAKSLIESGCENLMVVRAKASSYSSLMRTKGFIQQVSSHSAIKTLNITEVESETSDYEGGYQLAGQLLAKQEVPDGVFFCMDHIACGFMDAARKEFHLSIPQDMSLIGFDDIRLASYQSYALTTIKQCPKLVSKAVVDNLVKRLDEPSSSPMYQVVPVTLIRRDTLAS
ncbi:MAG: LacI family DNA-binding transcriptional regulator [Marinomonas sp.]